VVSKVPDRDLLPVGTQVYYYGAVGNVPVGLCTGTILRAPLNKYYALEGFKQVSESTNSHAKTDRIAQPEVVYIEIHTCFESQEQAKKHYMIEKLKGNRD
jgi:hypothetical protein